MKKLIIFILVFVVFSTLASNNPSYEQIIDDLFHLEKKNPMFSSVVNLGSTDSGTNLYGLLINNHLVTPQTLILVTGAIHGNEYMHVADQLDNAFLNVLNKEFYEYYNRGGAFFIVPIFNPDGFSINSRYNGNDRDLNRDFPNIITGDAGFAQKETKNLKVWIEKFLESTSARLEVTMDYHCCFNRTLLFSWSHTSEPIPLNDRERFNVLGEYLINEISDVSYNAVNELFWSFPDGTSIDYWYAKYGALALIYEGREKDEFKVINGHINWWKKIVSQY